MFLCLKKLAIVEEEFGPPTIQRVLCAEEWFVHSNMSKFQKELRKSRDFDKTKLKKRRRRWNHVDYFEALISVITLIAITSLEKVPQVTQVEGKSLR